MVRKIVLSFFILSLSLLAYSQQSASFKIEQGTFNNGGNPVPVLSSPEGQVTLDCVGDSLSATGASSPSYRTDPGLPAEYRPPGEVLNMMFSDKVTFNWNAEASVGTYNVYRGDLADLASGYGACLSQGLNATLAIDTETPPSGRCYFYLVTAENRVAEEGTMGKRSDGTQRVNPSPCS